MAAKKLYESFSKTRIDEMQRWGAMKQTGVSLRKSSQLGSLAEPLNSSPSLMAYPKNLLFSRMPFLKIDEASPIDDLR
ncbi:pyruvate dehydrogenase (acetyl-transferring) kinase, mitochondrial-like [Actinidia eriantha]|uniref:pyruvate dehydrogenase (acetyl-transferring) kinase, mitochondrial-like n=1 Tax=Actinidia eriantha TaxID=165200 RepID=UPI00258FF338|nr:pyruvate dehydrogenase (acetyl-transferring) kinase, mitochondrial-like [Actinidia eriantha]